MHKLHSVFSLYSYEHRTQNDGGGVGRGGKGGQVVVMHVHCGSSLLPAAPPPMQPSRQPDTSSWPHTHTPPLPLLASPASDFSFPGLSAWWGEGAGAPRQASPPPLCVRGLCWTGCCCSDLVRTHRVRQPPFNTCCSDVFRRRLVVMAL